MLNVLYIRGPNEENWEIDRKAKEEYLEDCFCRHDYWPLLDSEKEFIINLLLLIDRYVTYVLVEEEYNTITMARLLSLCPIRLNGFSRFYSFVEEAIENIEGDLTKEETEVLSSILSLITPTYTQDNILLTAQTVLLDSMFNSECIEAVANLLNLAVIRCNCKDDSTMALDSPLSGNEYLAYVLPEFSERSETLMKVKREKVGHEDLFDYAMSKWPKLPEALRLKAKNYDLEICLTNELFGNTSDLRKMGSTHICGKKIRVWLEKNKAAIDFSFFHEMGHVADYLYGVNGLHSKTEKAWGMIFDLEKDKYWKRNMEECAELKKLYDYAVSNVYEYFACTFSDYIQKPEWLMETAPNTYHYLDAMFAEDC